MLDHSSSGLLEISPSPSVSLPVRHAAKLALRDPSGSYLFVRGERPFSEGGMLNLPGGGIDPGETPEDALLREFREETGLTIPHDRLLPIGSIEGEVTSQGKLMLAKWTLFAGFGIIRPSDEVLEQFPQEPYFLSAAAAFSSALPISSLALLGVGGAEVAFRQQPGRLPVRDERQIPMGLPRRQLGAR